MKEFKASSGADVVISIASFEDSMLLKDAISSTLSSNDIDIKSVLKGRDNILGEDVSKVFSDLIEPIFRSIVLLDSSKELRKCLFKCLEKCKYDREKITMETFESPKARGDYYEIMIECLKVNLLPFFQNLASKLPALKKIVSKTQKSK